MIHIGTLHYRSDRWIEVQLRYLERHTHEPYRVYASLDRIDPRHRSRYDHVRDDSEPPSELSPNRAIDGKLNRLTEEMVSRAEPDDLLVIMHGDTVPITDWVGRVRAMIEESRLVAICREEIGEPIPHWSFAATTPGFWSEIGGDWSFGPTWTWNGEVLTDTGAKLWEAMEARGLEWRRLLRSNETNLNPLLFGVYGDLVYHHGAAFRPSITRYDSISYVHLPIPVRNFAGVRRRLVNTYRSERLIRRIRRDERFYRELIGDRL